jgi:DNA-binding transcriptional regulator LsrR (DeoR family)
MALVDELRLMTKVARLYYQDSVGQREIAAQLDVSQASVSRLLKRAEQEHIVRIVITPPQGVFAELETGLEQRYGLKEVLVVDCESEDEDLLRNLGSAAAYYIETTVKPDEVIGVSSWSATLLAVVDAMHPQARSLNTHVVQILGGMGNPAAEEHANHLISRLAALVRGQAHFLPAPGVVSSADVLPALLNDAFVSETLQYFDRVTLALVGIGSLSPSRLLASSGNVFSEHELEMLHEHGAVGDLCLRFYDAQGQPVTNSLDQRVISMTLEQLKHVKRSVGVAGGVRKYEAVRGAIVGGWINVLVTDRWTAEKLLKEPVATA